MGFLDARGVIRRRLPVLLMLCVSLWLTACDQSGAQTAPYYHQVAAITLAAQPQYSVQRYFVGRVEARQRAQLGFELPGTIAEVRVDEGDQVQAGQLLAQLDSRLLESDIQVIGAEREDIEARRQLASIEIKRQRELISKGFTAEQRVDQLQAELTSLDAQLKRQQALLESAQTRLAKHAIYAPYQGEIARRYSDDGAVIGAGQALLQLLEQGQAQARVGVPLRLLANLQPGDEVQVLEGERMLTAKVLVVGTNVDAITRTATVRLALPEQEQLADGALLYLVLNEQVSEPGYWVPDTALTAGVRGMWNVYALAPSEQAPLRRIEARSIELLHMAEGRAFIRGAVSDGEQLVANGLHRVAPGLLVRVAGETKVAGETRVAGETDQ